MKSLGFIEDSLERSNNIEIFGGDSAKESAILYAAHENTGLPPEGTFVFYDCAGEVDDKHVDRKGDANMIESIAGFAYD